MNEVIRCPRCILPSSLTGLIFDENGVCNHCRKYEDDFKFQDSIKESKAKDNIRNAMASCNADNSFYTIN